MRYLLLLVLPGVLWADDERLELEPLKTTITVRGTLDSPSSGYITSVSRETLESHPGVNVDDRLREVPGFTLFRRSSSLVAHPTTQGISLRGIGSSAAGRTLVLYDGFPLNDPFGGWVYWSRVNPDAIDAVEISRGATTSVYGDRAMGGVISLLTPAPESRHVWAGAEGGAAGIADVRGGFSDLFGKLGLSSFVRGLRSEGYFIVPEENHGPVDRRADADFVVGDLRFDYFGKQERLMLRANVVTERRQNGTPLRTNSSSLGTAGVHYQRQGLSFSGYHSRGVLRNGFSFVNQARNFERQTLLQRVTSEDSGGSILWKRPSRKVNLILGTDAHRAGGMSRDTVVSTGFVRRPGGRLWQQGVFVQADFAAGPRTQIYGGLRHDFTDRGNDFWSPRAGLAFSEGPRRWRASVYRSFRAPTLNEFFRQFRVGNITTLGNPELSPETMLGAEAGLDWRKGDAIFRTTLFWQQIDDLIGNATIRLDPSPLRQRRNLGKATGRGVELEVLKTFGRFRAEAAYLYVDSQLDTNVWMPQVPRHQGSFQLLYAAGKTLFRGGIRSYAAQFEDDLNLFLLPGFATLQVMLQQRLGHGVSALLAVENLLDRRFLVGFVPTPTTGAPRLMRVGLKWEMGR